MRVGNGLFGWALAAALLAGCGSAGDVRGDDDDASGAGANAGTGAGSAAATTGSGTGGGAQTAGAGGGGGGAAGGAGGGVSGPGYSIEPAVSWHQPALGASLHFAPLDDLEERVLAELDAAKSTLRLAFFNIRLKAVRDLLKKKVQAGLDVHVLLDKKQQDLEYNTMDEELAADGVPFTLIDNQRAQNATMHDKFTVVDGHRVLTGSANYSTTALNVSDEDLLVIDNADLAQRYEEEFTELVTTSAPGAKSAPYAPGTAVQAWMGPEDGLAARVAAAIDAAKKDVAVAMFDLNATTIVTALLDAKKRGVNVLVLLDKVQADEPDAQTDEALAKAGIHVVLAHNTGGMFSEMHSKLCVIDHTRLIMGSYNWTSLASYYNDENMLVVDDAHLAARAEGKIAELVDAYATKTPSALGLVTGKQQVVFEVGNVKLESGAVLTLTSVNGPFTKPVELAAGKYTAQLAAGTRLVYRYAVRSAADGTVLVEEKGTHHFTVPYAPGPFALTDAFEP
jgi:HKD family nuclease